MVVLRHLFHSQFMSSFAAGIPNSIRISSTDYKSVP